ncbi:hypothetical protein P7K49_027211, partial [Saguinus oedipus]
MVECAALLEAAETLDLVEVFKGLIQEYEHYKNFQGRRTTGAGVEGSLQCAELGHLSHISRGDPNILLSDEETKVD